MNDYTPKFLNRFWSKVDVAANTDECWPWNASVDKFGYGQVWHDRRLLRSHRVAYEIVNGDPGPLYVLHSCDNPLCCNPTHLFLGTQADNMRDKQRKNRAPKGEAHATSKYSDAVIDELKRRFSSGEATIRELADEYHMSRVHVWEIVTYRSRK